MGAIATILDLVLQALLIIILINAILSWVRPDPSNPIVMFLERVSDAVCDPIRRLFPTVLGGHRFRTVHRHVSDLVHSAVRGALAARHRHSNVTARLRVRVHPGANGSAGARMARGRRRFGSTSPRRPKAGGPSEALTRFLAGVLGLDAREVEVIRGHASRDKVVAVKGMEPNDLRSRIDGALDPGDPTGGE